MDFKQFFNTSDQPQTDSANHSPEELVKALLDEATKGFQQDDKKNVKMDGKAAAEAFKQKYGSLQEFVTKHYPERTAPFEDAALKGVYDYIHSLNKKVPGPTAASGIIDAARFFCLKIMHDNCSNPIEEMQNGLKSAALGTTIAKQLPEGSPQEDMISIIGLLAVASMKMAQLSVYMEAQELMGLTSPDQD